jgi:hypothetical protein
MATPFKLAVLGCSGYSTGELTLALDWAKRCRRDVALTILVPKTLAPSVAWTGARVVTFPQRGGFLGLSRVRRTLADSPPDALLLADLLLFHDAPYEFGLSFAVLADPQHVPYRVLGLDLFDWDARGRRLDLHGVRRFAGVPDLPAGVGRLMPSPYLAPGPSTPGRGRYAMMEDGTPMSDAERAAAREELGLGSGKVALVVTSPWQHLARMEEGARHVTNHLPALLLRVLDLAARRLGGLTLVHLGPAPMVVPPDVTGLSYRHVPQLPPGPYRRLLGCVDAVVTPNCIGSSVIRAASLRVPVASFRVGRAVEGPPPGEPRTPAQSALHAYLQAVCPTYGFLVWPLGLQEGMEEVLRDNPFSSVQRHLDLLAPDDAVDGLWRLLSDPAEADGVRHDQARYFSVLRDGVNSPEEALDAALQQP